MKKTWSISRPGPLSALLNTFDVEASTVNSENQAVNLPILTKKKITLFVKREDLLHPIISGNKYRKLNYNLQAAKAQGFSTLLTFGGAYSNHILATACAAHENGFNSIGIVRGEELVAKWHDNPTLAQASAFGMQLKFVSRATYKNKHSSDFLEDLKAEFGSFYVLPEGGTNDLAVKGCMEILTENDRDFNTICCCVGTGGTISGLINSVSQEQRVIGFPALKGDFLKEDIRKFANNTNWELQNRYHFGGYAKLSAELIHFINAFKKETGIPLDPVYTAKMMYGILDMVERNEFKRQTQILAIHTGGMQGVSGMNKVLEKKNLPQIDL